MAQDYAASVAGTHLRVTRLSNTGAPLVGENNSYVTSAFISVSMTPEFEEGDEFTQKAANGTVCATFKAPDTLKRVSLEIAVCNPDPEFAEIISGGELLADAAAPTETLGWAAPKIGEDAMPNGVAIEVWSRAIVDGKPAAENPYWHWLFPYAIMRPGGDRVIENGMLATSYEGWAVGNSNFGDGPAAPHWPFISDRAYAFARTDGVPVTESGSGYEAVVVDLP